MTTEIREPEPQEPLLFPLPPSGSRLYGRIGGFPPTTWIYQSMHDHVYRLVHLNGTYPDQHVRREILGGLARVW